MNFSDKIVSQIKGELVNFTTTRDLRNPHSHPFTNMSIMNFYNNANMEQNTIALRKVMQKEYELNLM